MPGEVVARVAKGPAGMFARVKYPNGDQVMVSMAAGEIKLFKMKLGGLVPGETLVTLDWNTLKVFYDSSVATSHEGKSTDVLDGVTSAILAFDSASAMRDALKKSGAT